MLETKPYFDFGSARSSQFRMYRGLPEYNVMGILLSGLHIYVSLARVKIILGSALWATRNSGSESANWKLRMSGER